MFNILGLQCSVAPVIIWFNFFRVKYDWNCEKVWYARSQLHTFREGNGFEPQLQPNWTGVHTTGNLVLAWSVTITT